MRRAGGGQATAHVSFVPRARGLHAVPTLMAETRFPLGLFRAWTVWRPAAQVLVYPRPESDAPLPPRGPAGGRRADPRGQRGRRGRRRARLPARRRDELVVWKKAAQAQTGPSWSAATPAVGAPASCGSTGRRAAPLAPEARLSRLAAWTLAAERAGADFGLRLPGLEMRPAAATRSGARCLEALALWQRLTHAAFGSHLAAALARLAPPAARGARHAVPARRDRLDGAAAPRTCRRGASR